MGRARSTARNVAARSCSAARSPGAGNRGRAVGVLAFMIAVGGCAAPTAPPMEPINWLPTGGTFELPPVQPGNDYALDLPTVLKLAGTKPLAIELAVARAQEAAAEEDAAFSKWLPSLQPRLSFLRTEGRVQSTQGNFLDVEKQSSFAGGAVDLSIDLADAWYERLSAAQRRRSAELGIRSAQHINVGKAVELYYELVRHAASLQILERSIEHATKLVGVEEARASAGRGLNAHVLRASAHLALVEGQRASAVAGLEATSAQMTALLLLPDGVRLVAVEPEIAPIHFAEADLDLPDLLDLALSARPDLGQAEAIARAVEFDHDRAAWGWLLPDLTVGAGHGSIGTVPSELEDQELYYATVEWDWGFGGIANARAADARRIAARIDVQRMRREIRSDVQSVKARLTSATIRMAAAARGAEAARAAHTLVGAQHREGKALLIELLDAERANTEASINLVLAIGEHNRSQFELRQLIGGEPQR